MNALLRLSLLVFALMLLPALGSAQDTRSDQSSTPLGDIARQLRAAPGKKSAKVITEDNLEKGPDFANGAATPPTAAAASSNPATPANPDTAAPANADAADQAKEAKEPGQDRPTNDGKTNKAEDQLRTQYLEQKKSLGLLERELNVLQREFEIQTTMFYADAGTQLRDSAAWSQKRKKHEDDIAEKQKQIDKAKEALESLREQGRKAGVSPSTFED